MSKMLKETHLHPCAFTPLVFMKFTITG